MDYLRRRLFSAAPPDVLGSTLKVRKWLPLNHPVEQNLPLCRGYLLKEQLRALLRYLWTYIGVLRTRLHEWILAAFDAELPAFATVANRLARHLNTVIAGINTAPRWAGGVTQQPDRRPAIPGTGLLRPRVLQAQDPPALRDAAYPVGEDRSVTSGPRISERSRKSNSLSSMCSTLPRDDEASNGGLAPEAQYGQVHARWNSASASAATIPISTTRSALQASFDRRGDQPARHIVDAELQGTGCAKLEGEPQVAVTGVRSNRP